MSLTATPERIAQFTVSSAAALSVYTVTSDRVVLRDINICRANDAHAEAKVTFAIVPSGESYATKHIIIYKMSVRRGESLNLSDYRLVLHSGDQIYMASDPESVSVYLSGGKYFERT